jgi:hypothetical protein
MDKTKYARGRAISSERQFNDLNHLRIIDENDKWWRDSFLELSDERVKEFKGQVCIKCTSAKVTYVYRTYYYYFEKNSFCYIAKEGGRNDINGEIIPFLCAKCYEELPVKYTNYPSLIGRPLPIDEPDRLGGTCNE